MIKNARQYRLTRSHLERFRAALDHAEAQPDDGWKDLDVSAVKGQIIELEQELAEYEGLRSGSVAVGTPERLDDAIAWCTEPEAGPDQLRLVKVLRRWRKEIVAPRMAAARGVVAPRSWRRGLAWVGGYTWQLAVLPMLG